MDYQDREGKYELVIPNSDLPFKMFLFEGQNGNYQVPRHWHSSIEIFLVMEGYLEFFMDSTCYPLHNMEAVLVNSNQIHSITATNPNQTIVLQIPIQVVEKYCNSEGYIYFRQEEFAKSQQNKELIFHMFRIYQKKEFGYELQVMSLFYKLLHRMMKENLDISLQEEQIRLYQNLNRLSKITKYIKKNYKQEISLQSVAKEFGFSSNYLSRMFQKYANMNYKTYVLDIRTEYARKELIATKHSINDIALNNGFPSSKSFSRAFMARYGMLPSVYRKEEIDSREEVKHRTYECAKPDSPR